jgi:protein SCO1
MRALFAALCIAAAGCTGAAAEVELPYYGSADFTPHWQPVAHRLPAFSLTTQTGAPLTDADLRGRVHVASFIYTRCPSICPVLIERLRPLQSALRDRADVSLISYSVTPELDPPPVLREFGEARHIDPAIWKLVTGSATEVRRLMLDFYFAADTRLGNDALLHTEKVLLVDREGHLRGVYNGTHAFEMEKLREDIARLR